MEWKCICGEWVSDRHPAHTHAAFKEGHDREGSFKTIGYPPEIWTYEREPNRPVRAIGK